MKNIRLNSRGFSLVEMALVMVVVGIVLGIGAGMIGPLTTMSKTRESRETVEADIASIASWAASNNRLPQWGDGTADAIIDEFAEVAKKTTDAWGRPLIYLYDNNLFNAFPTKDTICGRKTTAITIIDNTVNPVATINNVAFAIISQGEDALTQTTLNGTLNGVAVPGAVIAGSGIATGTITLDPTVSDTIRWVTLDELRSKIGCQGAQLKIVNNELPYGNKGSAYPNVSFIPDGGVQFTPTTTGIYEWCWSSTTLQVLSDLTFTCSAPSSSATIARTASPTTCSLTTGTWQRCTSLNLSSALLNGINPSPGSVDISLALRDNGGNITQKTFVLTINPLSP